jgi:hypothetical protein
MTGERFKNYQGMRNGRLTAIRFHSRENSCTRWLCLCDCGNYTVVTTSGLKRTQSCGCLLSEHLKTRNTRHNLSKSRTHRIWASMLSRCENPNREAYVNYGGRGISVCEEWKVFERFLADMGEAPEKYTIDRIDNDKGYDHGNCKWSTRKDQARNRRSNHLIVHNGRTQCLSAWAEEFNIPVDRLKARLRYGWNIELALAAPARKRGPSSTNPALVTMPPSSCG